VGLQMHPLFENPERVQQKVYIILKGYHII